MRSSSDPTRSRFLAIALTAAVAFACAPRVADEELCAVHVAGVAIDPSTESPVVQLVEDGEQGRELRIWIGEFEARSIESAIERTPVVRPNSHDLLTDVLTRVDGHVQRTVVTELRDGTYYAVIEVDLHGRELRIDARPSDAIALALRTGAPVLVRESLLEREIEIPDDEAAVEIDVIPPVRDSRDTPRL